MTKIVLLSTTVLFSMMIFASAPIRASSLVTATCDGEVNSGPLSAYCDSLNPPDPRGSIASGTLTINTLAISGDGSLTTLGSTGSDASVQMTGDFLINQMSEVTMSGSMNGSFFGEVSIDLADLGGLFLCQYPECGGQGSGTISGILAPGDYAYSVYAHQTDYNFFYQFDFGITASPEVPEPGVFWLVCGGLLVVIPKLKFRRN